MGESGKEIKVPMANPKNSENVKNPSRRAFLKTALIGLLAVVATRVARKIKEEIPPDAPEYLELSNGKKINFFLGKSNKTVLLTMSYLSNKMSSLYIRLSKSKEDPEKKEPLFLEFSPGAENRRHTGEIIEPRIYKLEIDREKIGDGYNVGLYPNPNLHVNLEGRIDCPENDNLWGVPVITAPDNLLPGLKDEQPPLEINAGHVSESWMNIHKFGQGWLVGKLTDSPTQGEKTFLATGYVNDARVFKPVE